MKTYKELIGTPHLSVASANRNFLSGTVQWDDLKFCGTVLAGFNEDGWEHVSVSSYKKKQLPSWEVMCRLKDMFWHKEEEVVQIHPRESEYIHGVNDLGNVLHLWRPVNGDWSVLNRKEKENE